ncbi:MAG: hypothetical protein NTY32_06200 [Bacteroidia bacterium]|nr:hypothetical protein [Bacteroidia bacterium]
MRSLVLYIYLILPFFSFAQTNEGTALRNLEKEAEQIQSENKGVYSGGMLLFQPGYTITSNDRQEDIKASSFAIGGILRLYFGKNLTAGIFGGSQKTTYPSAHSVNSYFNFGYGGPFIGLTRKSGKIRYTVSAFAGMGSIRNLHIENQTGEVLDEAYLYQHSALVYSPIISLDYALTKRLSLTFQTLCLTGSFDGGRKFYNPTMQFGVLFSR